MVPVSTISSDHDDATGPSNTSHSTSECIMEISIAENENKWVWWLRLTTGTVLLTAAIIICLAVYLTGSQSETDAFEIDFRSLGAKVVSSFEQKVHQSFQVLESYNQGITVEANGTWPFVTPLYWSERMEQVVKITGFMVVTFLPVVERKDLEAWNHYSIEAKNWRSEGMAREQRLPLRQVEDTIDWYVDYVYNPFKEKGQKIRTEEVNPKGPYSPVWCTYPVSDYPTTNLDLFADWEHIFPINKTIHTGKPTFEYSYDYLGHMERDIRWDYIKGNKFVDYRDDPHATVVYPVFSSLGQNKKVVATQLVYIYWRTFFNDILPAGADGVIVVLESTCNQTYTYQVDGADATWLGRGDFHDIKYDHLVASTNINSLAGGEELFGSEDFVDDTESDMNYYDCHYNIRVYPSKKFEDNHRSNKPWVFACIVAGLLVFTTAVFATYDRMVERRQRKVLQSALQSGTLVSALFPEDVRKRLYEDQLEQAKQQKQDGSRGSANDVVNNHEGTIASPKEAIAKLYPDTTIFLADICGFTKWSASRSPTEVFRLLESIYGTFDAIARKLNVFKVETIGDSYVAATGLPEPQKDHAVVMCKFAHECLQKLDALVVSLAESLGKDTACLGMRVGLNSGSITAGVLRGDRGRFQLFGDTINTAARMESTGVVSRIHVSETTADALRASGKCHWLKLREDKIVAKGKGGMTTYFVQVCPRSSGTTRSTSD